MPDNHDRSTLDEALELDNVAIAAEKPDGTLVAYVTQKLPEADLNPGDIVSQNVSAAKTDVVDLGFDDPDRDDALDPLLLDPEKTGADNHRQQVNVDYLDADAIDDHRRRHRPIPAGVSEIHASSTAATAGHFPATVDPEADHPNDDDVVWDTDVETRLLRVANNHVYARSNRAEPGDRIIQQSPYDGGRADSETSGHLVGYAPLRNGVTADVAVRTVPTNDEGEPLIDDDGVYGVSEEWPTSIRRDVAPDAVESETFLKSGRTTGITRGRLLATNAAVNVAYPTTAEGGPGTVRLYDQLVFSDMSEGGDSSGPIYDADGAFVGQVFAGSPRITAANRADAIESELGVTLHTTDPNPPDDEPEPEPEPDPPDDDLPDAPAPPDDPSPPPAPDPDQPIDPPDDPEPPGDDDRNPPRVPPRPPRGSREGEPGGPYPLGRASTEDRWHFPAALRRVVDGDTLDVRCDLQFYIYRDVRLRLAGVDTDEIYGAKGDSEEYARGIEQRDFVNDWFETARTEATDTEWPVRAWVAKETGKYGRFIADIQRTSDDEWLVDALIEEFGDDIVRTYNDDRLERLMEDAPDVDTTDDEDGDTESE